MSDVGQILVEANIVTAEQVSAARNAGGDLGETLVKQRMVSDADYVQAVSARFGLSGITASQIDVDSQAVEKLAENVARGCGCVPVKIDGAMLHLATTDPGNERAIDRITRATGLSAKLFVIGPTDLERAFQRVYGGDRRGAKKPEAKPKSNPLASQPSLRELDDLLKHAVQEATPEDNDDADEAPDRLEVRDLDPPVVKIINGLLIKALHMGVSDLHLEPLENAFRVRFRVDGCLQEVVRLPSEMKSSVASCLKIMSNMDIAERRVPQDGGIKLALTDNENIDFRVSSLPNLYGEKLVLRVLGTSDLRDSVDDLGFEGRNLELVREAIENPYGMILVTGPTGSGKTTTLYTILNQLNEPNVNVLTAEDPVEYRLDGITQVNVRPTAGLTFDAALRSFLRQDPDIILVGEMRDYETAAIATKAALTGHLVLSTLHTNDAPSTVVRMVDMGIEPYLVASAVKLVVAQRLVRRICTNCKTDVDLGELERSDLDQTTLASVEYLARGAGCDTCNNIGYKGRIPVFEVLSVKTPEMKRAITEGGTEVQVGQIAKREGMHTLTDYAIELVNKGLSSLEEAASIIVAE
ncbi:MAG: type II secretion system protein GspE [Planctomycetes bacterium]|nr:type II secretion system protein GspE [Planctomycetota bacterium]